MMFDFFSNLFQFIMFTVFPFIAVLLISLRILRKKAQTKRYEKPQTKLEEILGF